MTATRPHTDIRSLPPAAAARAFGLIDTPLLCAQEMASDIGLKRCIRLMLHIDDKQRVVFSEFVQAAIARLEPATKKATTRVE